MSADKNPEHKVLSEKLRASLDLARDFVKGRKKLHNALVFSSVTSSAAATLVAGVTAAQGPVVGTGPAGWRLACTVAAVFGFTATVSNGISQQLKVNEKLVEGTQCLKKLRSLDIGLTTGSKGFEEVTREYQEIARTYPEMMD
ncbi:MAG: hypothetical protein U5K99_02160 [Anaerolineales bacterium]|nr:hypothetical protein [Anaerolineales bacterium]